MAKISRSSPPMALPSSLVSASPLAASRPSSGLSECISASRGTESLGLDPGWVVAHRHQQRGGSLDQRGWPADEDGWRLVLCPRDLLKHLSVDAPAEAHPPCGLFPRQRVVDVESVTRRPQPL